MDAAGSGNLASALGSQAARLSLQEDQMASLSRGVQNLSQNQDKFMAVVTTQLSDLANQIQQLSNNSSMEPMKAAAPVVAPTPTVIHAGPGLRLASPVRYSGEPGRCKTFLTECDMHFEFSPQHFLTDRAKVGFIISNLVGRAQTWATAEWGRNSRICQTLQEFQQAIRRTFDPVGTDRDTARQLCGLRQGKDTVSDYAIRFRNLAAESDWNTKALYDTFFKGLTNFILERLLPIDLPSDLDSLIALVIRTDNRLEELKSLQQESAGVRIFRPHTTTSWRFPTGLSPEQDRPAPVPQIEEPMQMGRARLPPEERQRRMREGRCLYCGELGHLVATCPTRLRRVPQDTTPVVPTTRTLTPIQVKHHTLTITMEALIDSGADESLMDEGLARKLGLTTKRLGRPVMASSLNGQELFVITHAT